MLIASDDDGSGGNATHPAPAPPPAPRACKISRNFFFQKNLRKFSSIGNKRRIIIARIIMARWENELVEEGRCVFGDDTQLLNTYTVYLSLLMRCINLLLFTILIASVILGKKKLLFPKRYNV
jgi:hypothetical protein